MRGAVASPAPRTENCVFEPSLALLARTPAREGVVATGDDEAGEA